MAGPSISAFYNPRQIGELKKKLGITLDNTSELLNEPEFAKVSRLAGISRYRKNGLIEPVGFAMAASKISAYYHPRQIAELKKKLGITLDNTSGLFNETEFRKLSGLSAVNLYRKKGFIKPVGYAMSATTISPYYHPRQIGELKKKLGITLGDITGLLNENQFAKASRLTNIITYRKNGLIKPVGFAMAGPSISAFYNPRQIAELKKKLGITLDNTSGLLNEPEFAKASRLAGVSRYRKNGLIEPVGFAMAGSKISAYYHPSQIAELKKKLGITLDNTSGLLNEPEFAKAFGNSRIGYYRQEGLIKPVGYAMAGSKISAYYHPRQIAELKKKIGITLGDITGLLNETQIRKVFGISAIHNYRKKGVIKPVGYALNKSGLASYYRPKQITELKKKLGITLDDVTGLITENQFSQKTGFTNITKYRKKGLIVPVGYALSNSGVSPFYHPRQFKELKIKLGITIYNTTGLLNERQFGKAFGSSRIGVYRKKGLISPVGYAMSNAGLSPFYHPRQIKELKAKFQKIAANKSKQ